MPDTNLVCYCNNVNQNQVKSEYVKRLTYPYQSWLWKKIWGKLPIWYGNQVWGSLFRVLIWQFQLFFSEVYFCFLILQIYVIRCWLWGLVWQDLSAEFLVQWLLLIVGFTAFPPALFTAPWVVVSIETGLLGLELSWGSSQVWTWSIFLGSSIFFSSTSYMIGNMLIQLSLIIAYQQKALIQTNGLSSLQQYHIAEWCSFCLHFTQPQHHSLCLFGTSNALLSTSSSTLTVNSWVPGVKPTEAENRKPTALPVPLRLRVSPVCNLDLGKYGDLVETGPSLSGLLVGINFLMI